MISFYLDRQLGQHEILDAVAKALDLDTSQIEIIAQLEDLADKRDHIVCLLLQRLASGNFTIGVDINYDMGNKREEVLAVQRVCQYGDCKALLSDEEINPYSWILIDRSGAFSVFVNVDQLDNHEGFKVERYKPNLLGIICTEHPLDRTRSVQMLSEMLSVEPQAITVQEFSDVPLVPVEDRAFPYGYSFDVDRIDPWLSLEEAAHQWMAHSKTLANGLGIALCIHHPAFHRIVNIPGGTDSEEHCYYYEGTELRKIQYKRLRESW